MRLVDANVLLYSVNASASMHDRSRRWLDEALSGGETVAFAWIALLAFVRLSTKVDLHPEPLSIDAAMDRVDSWLSSRSAVVLEPTIRHAGIVRDLLSSVGTGANLVNDAHLAALSIEHRCGVLSYDNDFSRFPGVEWTMPP